MLIQDLIRLKMEILFGTTNETAGSYWMECYKSPMLACFERLGKVEPTRRALERVSIGTDVGLFTLGLGD